VLIGGGGTKGLVLRSPEILKEIVIHNRFKLQGFGWGNFGFRIDGRVWEVVTYQEDGHLPRGGHTWRLD